MGADEQNASENSSTDKNQEEDKGTTSPDSDSQRTSDPSLIYIRSRGGDHPKDGDQQDQGKAEK